MSNKLEKMFQVVTLAAGLSVAEGCYGQGDDCNLISNNPELSSSDEIEQDCGEVITAVYSCLFKDKTDSSNFNFEKFSAECYGGKLNLTKSYLDRLGKDDSSCVRGVGAKLSCNFM